MRIKWMDGWKALRTVPGRVKCYLSIRDLNYDVYYLSSSYHIIPGSGQFFVWFIFLTRKQSYKVAAAIVSVLQMRKLKQFQRVGKFYAFIQSVRNQAARLTMLVWFEACILSCCAISLRGTIFHIFNTINYCFSRFDSVVPVKFYILLVCHHLLFK